MAPLCHWGKAPTPTTCTHIAVPVPCHVLPEAELSVAFPSAAGGLCLQPGFHALAVTEPQRALSGSGICGEVRPLVQGRRAPSLLPHTQHGAEGGVCGGLGTRAARPLLSPALRGHGVRFTAPEAEARPCGLGRAQHRGCRPTAKDPLS